jgi:hypothetical protein
LVELIRWGAGVAVPDAMTGPREIARLARGAAESMPRWALPFYWVSAACLLLFAIPIWLVARFCISMRPLYQRRSAASAATISSNSSGT